MGRTSVGKYCMYSELIDWEDDPTTGKTKAIYWCDKHKKVCATNMRGDYISCEFDDLEVKMAKYYAITAGEYSDYHIVHITTDRKLAEAYVKLHANRDYDSEYMDIEEFDDLVDQCDIQDTFDEANMLHPYYKVHVSIRGHIEDSDIIMTALENKNPVDFHWGNKLPKEPCINPYSVCWNFEMWVQVDKYNYDYDKIVRVVMDTRAKMLAEKEGL